MANNFKKQVNQQRAAVPQVDPEVMNEGITTPVQAAAAPPEAPPQNEAEQSSHAPEPEMTMRHITIVNTSESPVNRGFFMYPSRHRQIAKDLAYIEDRKPWQIIEAALEEYVVRHYGKEYKRK